MRKLRRNRKSFHELFIVVRQAAKQSEGKKEHFTSCKAQKRFFMAQGEKEKKESGEKGIKNIKNNFRGSWLARLI